MSETSRQESRAGHGSASCRLPPAPAVFSLRFPSHVPASDASAHCPLRTAHRPLPTAHYLLSLTPLRSTHYSILITHYSSLVLLGPPATAGGSDSFLPTAHWLICASFARYERLVRPALTVNALEQPPSGFRQRRHTACYCLTEETIRG